MKNQHYKTLKSYNESELKEKKSVFIAKAFPVNNEDEAKNILLDLKKKYHDASHRCYAYRLLSGKSKYSDAGEPMGTAGIKILNAIDHYDLTNCLVIVIRYFGGTKLGIGPLGKAYYETTIQVLSRAEIIIKKPYKQMEIRLSIASYAKLNKIFSDNKIIVIKTVFDTDTKVEFLIPFENSEKIKAQIQNLLQGEVVFSSKNEVIFK